MCESGNPLLIDEESVEAISYVADDEELLPFWHLIVDGKDIYLDEEFVVALYSGAFDGDEDEDEDGGGQYSPFERFIAALRDSMGPAKPFVYTDSPRLTGY